MFRLALRNNEIVLKEYVIQDEGTLFIGRHQQSNNIVIEDPSVSRRHAKITLKGGNLVVRDVDSKNGILVNGKNTKLAKLNGGDVIKVGDNHNLKVSALEEEQRQATVAGEHVEDILANEKNFFWEL